VDGISLGHSKGLSVSHPVKARSADRFLIALDSTTVYLLEMTLYCNRNQKVPFTMETRGIVAAMILFRHRWLGLRDK
jgi:hypothetical protein